MCTRPRQESELQTLNNIDLCKNRNRSQFLPLSISKIYVFFTMFLSFSEENKSETELTASVLKQDPNAISFLSFTCQSVALKNGLLRNLVYVLCRPLKISVPFNRLCVSFNFSDFKKSIII